MTNKRKISDINPPGKDKEVNKKSTTKPKGRLKKKVILLPILTCLALALLLAAAYFLVKPKAEVEIWPVIEAVQFENQAIVDVSITQPIFNDENIIPGELIENEQSFSQEFPSTGQRLNSAKAQGTIRVYNAYSASKQTLIAQTRFVSDSGKLFRTPKNIVVPGAHYEGGKLVPGEVDIVVEAAEPGSAYNIDPATFSIPGLAGTASYTKIYARSFEPMSGGSESGVSQITQEDLDNAREVLEEKALEESKLSLRNSISQQDYIIIEEALSAEVIELTPLAEVGQRVDSFIFQAKAKAKALTFNKETLESFAQSYLVGQIPQGKKVVAGSLGVSYYAENVDLSEGKISVNIEMSGTIYSMPEESFLKEEIRNKRADEIKTILRNFPEIDRVQTRFWPFWTSRAPADTNRININVTLTQ